MEYITFRGVCKYYQMGEQKITALDHMEFEISQGEFCVIVGPSGAGKTTLLNILGGMDSCDEGDIYLDGVRISGCTARQLTEYRRHDVGFVFQFYNLVQNLTALENVELASEICAHPLDAMETLAQVGLRDRAGNFPAQLSGGEQQRVSIARCLMRETPVLLLDEATAALDNQTAFAVTDAILHLDGLTRMVVTHRLEAELLEQYDEIFVLRGGEVCERGRFGELMERKEYFYSLYNVTNG